LSKILARIGSMIGSGAFGVGGGSAYGGGSGGDGGGGDGLTIIGDAPVCSLKAQILRAAAFLTAIISI